MAWCSAVWYACHIAHTRRNASRVECSAVCLLKASRHCFATVLGSDIALNDLLDTRVRLLVLVVEEVSNQNA